ncbi:MAG: hypothetical protein IPO62_13670 [Saprospiraceae bacterium]|nr:hypothetical protein [Saprospiraceae bacterium]
MNPGNPTINILDIYFEKGHFENHLQLTRQFYIEKGVPHTYGRKIPEKSEKAKVFRNDSIELVKKLWR